MVASACAPLSDMPTKPASASDAALEVVVIVAFPMAAMPRFPASVTSLAEVAYASTVLFIKFSARDTKNHIQFQEHNSRFIGLIFSPEIYMDPEEYGFSVFRLKGDAYYNMMTDNYKIPWEILPIEDAQEVIADFKIYLQNYFLDKPLITELNE